MKIKRFISALLCGTMLAAVLSTSVFAATFSDVENDATVAWAKQAINEMTDKGYIKGYEDGTFKPQRAVSKVETLVLMSRILGVEDSEYSQTVKWADAGYSATVNAINTTYVDELSFLMYFDVLNITDLRDYASAANANTSLLRWQAAYLMVKLAGKDDQAQSAVLDENEYSDYASIPEAARPYVAYATNLGLMNGMGNDENGKAFFSPETTLTRAQMATLLNRMMEKMDRNYIQGKVSSIDTGNKKMVVNADGKNTTCTIGDMTGIKINGENSKFSRIESQSEVMVTYTFGDVRMIETVPPEENLSVYGIVVQTSDNSGGQQITIKDSEDENNKATYTFASNCKYTIKGSQGSYGDVKAGNFVRLVLSGSKVTECSVESKTSDVSGTFVKVNAGDDNRTTITIKNSDNEQETFDVSINGVEVTRNRNIAGVRDLAKNDSVVLSLTYGKVVSIKATSETENVSGTIKEIILSETPQITLDVKGKSETYNLTASTSVKVNGVDATIYDLRPGNAATVVTDGSNIFKIESSATSSTGKTTVTGKVVSINTTLKVITVTNSSGGTETVYYESGTTFLKSTTGKSITAKDIVAGSNITATGSDSTGYFVATIVISD